MIATSGTFALDLLAPREVPLAKTVDDPQTSCARGIEDAARFDLFRRAVCEQDQAAWAELVRVYHRLLAAWAQRHPAVSQSSEDADVWAQRAFARFFAAVPAAAFQRFTSLGSVLRYLKLCVRSEVLDEVRRRTATHVEPLREDEDEKAASPDAASCVEDDLAARALWRAIVDEAQNETERIVAEASFARRCSPREVAAQHPDQFATVADVYRVKRNLLERLRRSPAIRQFLEA